MRLYWCLGGHRVANAAPLVSPQVRLRVDALGHVLTSRGDERASSHAAHKLALGAFALAAALDSSAPFEEPLRALGTAAADDGLIKAVLGAIPDADAATVRKKSCRPWRPCLPVCSLRVCGWAAHRAAMRFETRSGRFLACVTDEKFRTMHAMAMFCATCGTVKWWLVVTVSGCLHSL